MGKTALVEPVPVLYKDPQAEGYKCCNDELRGGGSEDCEAVALWLDARPLKLRPFGLTAYCDKHKRHAIASGQARLQVAGDLDRWEDAGYE